MRHPSWRNFKLKIAVGFPGQDGYFLFFRFRIATTSKATVSMICISSYVLINTTPFLQNSGRVEARPRLSG